MKTVLAAPERLAALLWGILIVMTVTGSTGAFGRADARSLLEAGAGAALAWAIVEASMRVFEDVLAHRHAAKPLRHRTVLRRAAAAALTQLVAAIPVLLPLALVPDDTWALRTSHAVAVLALGFVGWWSGKLAKGRPWRWSAALVAVGALLVGALVVLEGL